MTEDFKKGILLQIDDKIETLHLRLSLNKETIILEEDVSPSLKEAVEFYQNIAFQNQQANNVIKECRDTINKLQLLKNNFTDLSIDVILNLYHNYESFTMRTFEQLVLKKLNVIESP